MTNRICFYNNLSVKFANVICLPFFVYQLSFACEKFAKESSSIIFPVTEQSFGHDCKKIRIGRENLTQRISLSQINFETKLLRKKSWFTVYKLLILTGFFVLHYLLSNVQIHVLFMKKFSVIIDNQS